MIEADGVTLQPCFNSGPVFDPPIQECTPRFPAGTQVTVTAVPDASVGARFDHWNDFRCPDEPTCSFTLNSDRDLSATFDPVWLQIFGGSFGAVTLDPPPGGDPCGTECLVLYPLHTTVTVTRDPAEDQNSTRRLVGVLPAEPGHVHGHTGPRRMGRTTASIRRTPTSPPVPRGC